METTTDTKRQDTEVLASDILIAIFVNIKNLCEKKQLFIKIRTDELQLIINALLLTYPGELDYLKKLFVFSNSGPIPYSPQLQEAVERLQLAGMICWPDIQEPNLMRLDPSAEGWYYINLVGTRPQKFPFQGVITCKLIAEKMKCFFSTLIVDRPHLMNC